MTKDTLNTLVLKRFCGNEYYPIDSANWSIVLYGLRESGFHELLYGTDAKYQHRSDEDKRDSGNAAHGH